jgi:hypothetical protein
MIALLLPIAHHQLVQSIPFAVPPLLIVAGLGVLAVRDRMKGRGGR